MSMTDGLVSTSLVAILLDRIRCLVHIGFFCCRRFLYRVSADAEAAGKHVGDGERKVTTVLVAGARMSKSLHLTRCWKRADPDHLKTVLVENGLHNFSGCRPTLPNPGHIRSKWPWMWSMGQPWPNSGRAPLDCARLRRFWAVLGGTRLDFARARPTFGRC